MMRTIRFTTAASLMLLVQLASANAASIVTERLDEVLPAAKEVAWERQELAKKCRRDGVAGLRPCGHAAAAAAINRTAVQKI